ncbi:diguanylate cyclase (GGDEF) domain-containing protein [Shewanella psychrophila]|uniref:Diguanylate cyclase (GGDEF) domain-containing protein n=1 Tax=Shewanella psychrophila TaxID=225848 RepID=A0A1S6HS08_9GAMM|nr:GGDEF domain-containing protein [Shewanella psychrophila]AQS38274.1 diguanylate cyclase (GGDEF) domain-containing protein [Shewanella psychrophila]
MDTLAIVLVIVGLLGLIASLVPTHQVCNIPDHQHNGWLVLLSMIFMFIFGYLGFLWTLFTHKADTLDLIIAIIFCGGGGFVWLVTKMSRETIFKLKKTIKEKHYQAHHDQLTGLPNRNQFYEEIDKLIATKDQVFSCLMMDLDDFKMINDTFGHAEGDHVLQVVADRIIKVIPQDGISARLGGDELTVVLPCTLAEDAVSTARAIQNELLKEISCENHSLIIGVSIGIAQYPKDGDSRKSIMKSADTAMYHAKKNDEHYQIYQTHLV